MQPPSYTPHQKRFVANVVLHALHNRRLTDVKPDNPENRLIIIGATPTGRKPDTIDETIRYMASTEGHKGLKVPITGVLILHSQLQAWLAEQDSRMGYELGQALALCRSVQSNFVPLPRVWDPVGHTVNGWHTRENPAFGPRVRIACLELLDIAIATGNVKTLAAG